MRSFLANGGSKRNHRWPLRSHVTLNGVQVPHVQQPQSWDGVSSKDKGEDLPLALPPRLLRSGINVLVITSADPVAHLCAALLVAPRSLQARRPRVWCVHSCGVATRVVWPPKAVIEDVLRAHSLRIHPTVRFSLRSTHGAHTLHRR